VSTASTILECLLIWKWDAYKLKVLIIVLFAIEDKRLFRASGNVLIKSGLFKIGKGSKQR
jgi:hypothetical protein